MLLTGKEKTGEGERERRERDRERERERTIHKQVVASMHSLPFLINLGKGRREGTSGKELGTGPGYTLFKKNVQGGGLVQPRPFAGADR